MLISKQRKQISSQNLPECAFYNKNLPECAFSLFYKPDKLKVESIILQSDLDYYYYFWYIEIENYSKQSSVKGK